MRHSSDAISSSLLLALLLLFLLFLLGDDSAGHAQPVILFEVFICHLVTSNVEVRVLLSQLIKLLVLYDSCASYVQKGQVLTVSQEALDAEFADTFAFGDFDVL